jgi:4-amino-4-deoxy-L-arabinose transferase-like glycosyltransferase
VPDKHRSPALLTAVLLAALGFFIRIGFIYVTRSYEDPRTFEYGEIAGNIVRGNGFARVNEFSNKVEPTSSHAPLYPFLLAWLSYGHGRTSHNAIQVLQAVIGILTALVMYMTARRLYGNRIGVIAAAGFLFYPPLIYYTSKCTPTVVFIFLLSVTVYLIMITAGNIIKAIAAGVFVGMTMMCDPVAAALVPSLVIWALVFRRLKPHLLVVILLAACAVLAPWTIRNLRIHHRLVPVTTQYAKNLWIGNNPRATGTDYYRTVPGQPDNYTLMPQTLPRAARIILGNMPESEQTALFLRETRLFLTQHPLQFIHLLAKKAYYYWWRTPVHLTASRDAHRFGIWHTLMYFPLLLSGCIGMYLSMKEHGPDISLIAMTAFFISCVYVIAHVGLARYRLPVETYLILTAAYLWHAAWSRYRRMRLY